MNQEVLLTRQLHMADKAGRHYDYRIVIGDKALSWATKKELPEPGKSIILWEQPVHTAEYALTDKLVIPPGNYGAGTTELQFVRKAKMEDHGPDTFTLQTNGGEKFLLKKIPSYGNKAWLFKNMPNKYLEKVAMMITHFKDPVTGKEMWIPETKEVPQGLVPTGAKKYIRRRSA